MKHKTGWKNRIGKGVVLMALPLLMALWLPCGMLKTKAAYAANADAGDVSKYNSIVSTYLTNKEVSNDLNVRYLTMMNFSNNYKNTLTGDYTLLPGGQNSNVYVGTTALDKFQTRSCVNLMLEFSAIHEIHDSKDSDWYNDDVEFSIVYEDTSTHKIYYTKVKALTNEADKFNNIGDDYNSDWRYNWNKVEQLPVAIEGVYDGNFKLLGIYLLNNYESYNWELTSFSVYSVLINPNKAEKDGDNVNYRIYKGSLKGMISKEDLEKKRLNGSDYDKAWLYACQMPSSYQEKYNYMLQLVTGNNESQSVKVTIEYEDLVGMSHSITTELNQTKWQNAHPLYEVGQQSYGDMHFTSNSVYEWWSRPPYSYSDGEAAGYYDYVNLNDIYRWTRENDITMNLLAGYLTGNYMTKATMDQSFLKPYTATEWLLSLPGGVGQVKKISVYNDSNKSLRLTDVRLITTDPAYFSEPMEDRFQMNGGLSNERNYLYKAVGVTSCKEIRERVVPYGGTMVCATDQTTTADAFLEEKMNPEKPGQSLRFENMDVNYQLAVKISFADVAGAGIESLMAGQRTGELTWSDARDLVYQSYGDNWEGWVDGAYAGDDGAAGLCMGIYYQMQAAGALTKNQASNVFNLLGCYYDDPLMLKVTYRDLLGAKREVNIPFVTAYMLKLFSENRGSLSQKDPSRWLDGILQQGQEAVLVIPLNMYGELIEIQLEYGQTGEKTGFTGMSGDSHYKLFTTQDIHRDYTKDISEEDPISIRAVTVYEDLYLYNNHWTNRVSVDDSANIQTETVIDGTPSYYYLSSDYRGTLLSKGKKLTVNVQNGSLKEGGASTEDDFTGKYLVVLYPSQVVNKDQRTKITCQLTYTTTEGQERSTDLFSVAKASADFYGSSGKNLGDTRSGAAALLGSEKTDGKCCFLVDIQDISTFDSIYLSYAGSGGDSDRWQVDKVEILRLTDYEARTARRQTDQASPSLLISPLVPYGGYVHHRKFDGEKIAWANTALLLSNANPSNTLNFSKMLPDGTIVEAEVKENSEGYLLGEPENLTYAQTLKNLGLSVAKHQYQVDVKVADVEDAGSGNYFYFQLVFKNGESGLVLANQQLASDSFREGKTESFVIKTTQDYGELQAVRIICDTTSSSSQAFDKLNIESITVSRNTKGGIGRSWVVGRVGWVDINYRDEAVTEVASSDETKYIFSNDELTKEYAVTRVSSNVTLMFALNTGGTKSYQELGGKFHAVLSYLDSNNVSCEIDFDLIDKINEFNETKDNYRTLRPDHLDRFTLKLNDVSSIQSLKITRSNGNYEWVGKSVAVSQVGELGRVYISSASNEYVRSIEGEGKELTVSTNQNVSIGGSNSGIFTFAQNKIEIDTSQEMEQWSTTITRWPTGNTEKLNIYLYAGSVAGRTYTFSDETPELAVAVNYTTKLGESSVQASFKLRDIGEVNGTKVLYGMGLNVSAMSNLHSMRVASMKLGGMQPIIKMARVERVQNNVIREVLYFYFAGGDLTAGEIFANATPSESGSKMQQIVRLQAAAGTNQNLIEETSDIAVALRYTSENDPGTQKTVYESQNVFLTDANIKSIREGQTIEIPFHIENVGEVVGIKIASTGPEVTFENAFVYNYTELEDGGQGEFLGSCQIAEAFLVDTNTTRLLKKQGQSVSPVTFTFRTPQETEVPGAGTSGKVRMDITYLDSNGKEQTKSIKNILDYFPADAQPVAGSEVSFNILMSNVGQITSLLISPETDDWYLSGVRASVQRMEGNTTTVYAGTSSVGRWADASRPLEILLNQEGSSSSQAQQKAKIIGMTLLAVNETGNVSRFVNSGEALELEVSAGDSLTLTPNVQTENDAAVALKWTESGSSSMKGQMNIGEDGKVSLNIPDTVKEGDTLQLTVYVEEQTQYSIPVMLRVKAPNAGNTEEDTEGASLSLKVTNETTRQTLEAASGLPIVMEVSPGDQLSFKADLQGAEGTLTWTAADGTSGLLTGNALVDGTDPGKKSWTVPSNAANGAELTVTVSAGTQPPLTVTVTLKVKNP